MNDFFLLQKVWSDNSYKTNLEILYTYEGVMLGFFSILISFIDFYELYSIYFLLIELSYSQLFWVVPFNLLLLMCILTIIELIREYKRKLEE